MRPKLSDRTFRSNFDSMDTHGQGFIEGKCLELWPVCPSKSEQNDFHDGRKSFCHRKIGLLFTTEVEDKYIAQHEDITRDGIIGNYVQGNEPGHHIPYLYNWTDRPRKTQSRVRMIMRTMYASEL